MTAAAVLMIWAHGVALGLWVGWARWRRPEVVQ